MKKITLIVCLFLLTLISPSIVLAQTFQLNSIGTVSVAGTSFSHFWYTSNNISFAGTTSAGSSVSVNIDSTANSATVDSAGSWSYVSSLENGDHQVVLSSAGETISFTLTVGSTQPDLSSSPGATTPVSGLVTPTILAILPGLGLSLYGAWRVKKSK